MDRKNEIILVKIIECIEKINRYISTVGMPDFLTDSKLIEACVFNLLQIGELANRLDSDFQQKHTDVPWHKMRGLRNRLVHNYEGVNFELVWDIIKIDLNALKKQLEEI
ncbi:MAG: DUF86 domain-containing protein [Oscillospiraceae bacterium]|nr:DUF86 domain-containing protein [Oscillospiraceae bacterium]